MNQSTDKKKPSKKKIALGLWFFAVGLFFISTSAIGVIEFGQFKSDANRLLMTNGEFTEQLIKDTQAMANDVKTIGKCELTDNEKTKECLVSTASKVKTYQGVINLLVIDQAYLLLSRPNPEQVKAIQATTKHLYEVGFKYLAKNREFLDKRAYIYKDPSLKTSELMLHLKLAVFSVMNPELAGDLIKAQHKVGLEWKVTL